MGGTPAEVTVVEAHQQLTVRMLHPIKFEQLIDIEGRTVCVPNVDGLGSGSKELRSSEEVLRRQQQRNSCSAASPAVCATAFMIAAFKKNTSCVQTSNVPTNRSRARTWTVLRVMRAQHVPMHVLRIWKQR